MHDRSGTWRMLSRPLQPADIPSGVDVLWHRLGGLGARAKNNTPTLLKQADAVLALEKEFQPLSEARLREEAYSMRDLFRLNREKMPDIFRAIAIVREVARRQRGEHPYRVQVAGALGLLSGVIVEMATGEGKTLTASLAATVLGWKGKGCHVITVNDYLAQRDGELMSDIYRFCGLNVSHIIQDHKPEERKQAYLADITYCTNKEVTADFLRDRLALGELKGLSEVLLEKLHIGRDSGSLSKVIQRGLAYAIIDEADSVLIDEAVTPLIISGPGPNPEHVEVFSQARDLAAQLEKGKDYKAVERYTEIEITNAGLYKLEELIKPLGGVWTGLRRAEELVTQALTASEFYREGKQYVIQEDKVVIVDEFTGRLMPDREWRDGLHQAVSAKEGLEVESPKDTYARISFQRFFRLYTKLSGMTGTATEARNEFWDIFRMPVVKIPTNKPCKRKMLKPVILASQEKKFARIVERIKEMNAKGQPVLVGTRSVRASEYLSELLKAADMEHQVLNATMHKLEAQIVTEAGQPGKITVATNMAGRGTDIKLGRGVADKGGLCVIATERHESSRVDRQLYGRCARQGDPGVAMDIICIDDELMIRHAPIARRILKPLLMAPNAFVNAIARTVFKLAAKKASRKSLSQRKSVLKTDNWLEENLGFASRM